MKPADNINETIKKLHIEPSVEMDKRIHNGISKAIRESKQNTPVCDKPDVWRILMNSKMTKLAVAAAIILVGMVIVNQFGGSIDGSSVAWADVLEQIYDSRTVTYKQTFETEKHTFTVNKMQMEPGLMRTEYSGDIINIRDFSTGINLQLIPQSKRALIEHRVGRKYPTRNHNRFEWLKKLHEQDTQLVGEEDIDGMMVNVFVSEVPFERMTVWVDLETNLPVKVKMESFPNTEASNDADPVIMPTMSLSTRDFSAESEAFTNEEGKTITVFSRSITIGSSRGSGKGIQKKMTVTYHNFNWDAELDKSLFSMVPPEGYAVKEKTFDVSGNGEDRLVYSLRLWATMSEGLFPDTINDLGEPDKLKPIMIAKFDKDGDPEEELDAAMDEVHEVLKGLYFAQEMKVDGRWGYAGQGVVLGQAEMIICWWFDEATEGYKAIYDDLTIENVAPEDLPE